MTARDYRGGALLAAALPQSAPQRHRSVDFAPIGGQAL